MASKFIRLRIKETRKRVVLNDAHIAAIAEEENGSSVVLANGLTYQVEETERKIRGLLAGESNGESAE